MKEGIQIKNNVQYVEIDIHSYSLYDVKTNLPCLIQRYIEDDFTHFNIIHGYNLGTVLKNYIRTDLSKAIRKLIDCGEIILNKERKGDTKLIVTGL